MSEFIAVVVGVVLLGCLLVFCEGPKQEKRDACSKACGIRKFDSIDGICHCKTETGWEIAR
jgi:hypothetical protein